MSQPYTPRTDIFIAGFGDATGSDKVDNRCLIERYGLPATEEQLLASTGIRTRYFLAGYEDLSDIAATAARHALTQAGLDIHAISRIIVATSTGDCLSPSTAAIVQHKLGSRWIPCHDVSAACSGFIYALDQAIRYLETGDDHILVIGADARSRTLDFSDPDTAALYGDGAGAFVVSRNTAKQDFRIRASSLFADALGHDAVTVASVGSHGFNGVPVLRMPDGKRVMKNAIKGSSTIWRQLAESLELETDTVKAFIFHQPNQHLLDAIRIKLGINQARFPCIFREYGNTVAASIPMAFAQAFRQRSFAGHERIVLIAIGGGFTGGGIVIN